MSTVVVFPTVSSTGLPPTRIDELLAEAEMSRVEVAVECGVGEMTVRRWAKGQTSPSDEQKFRLASLLTARLKRGITVEHLMGWDRPGDVLPGQLHMEPAAP
jgi:transcriptional regulator with XRE-family HTH domain